MVGWIASLWGVWSHLTVVCLERGEAVQREAEASDPFQQP